MNPAAPIQSLRKAVAEIEGAHVGALTRPLAFGVEPVDAMLRGGLTAGALHEFAPALTWHLGAATGLVLALAARRDPARRVLWIQTDAAVRDTGPLYGGGLGPFGLSLPRLLVLRVREEIDALWAMEEALKCSSLACVCVELTRDDALDGLTATRRLNLAARQGGGFGFLLRHAPSPLASSAETRWQVASLASVPDAYGGLGRTAFSLSLVKNRHGLTGQWTIEWDPHERRFSTLRLGMAQAPVHRPHRAPQRTAFVRAG